jgi:hypothetical protein
MFFFLIDPRFSGSDIDAESLEWALKNVKLNGNFSDFIDLYKTENCDELQGALFMFSLEQERALSLEKEQSRAKTEQGVTAVATSDGRGQDNTVESNRSSDRSTALSANGVNNGITRFLLSSGQVPCTPSPLLPAGKPPAPCVVQLLGPVRSALMVSGSHRARTVRALEQEFVDNNSSSVRNRLDGVKIMTKADIICTEHAKDNYEEHSEEHSSKFSEGITDTPIEHSHSDRGKVAAEGCEIGSQSREGPVDTGREGSLYTAVMTNPPFYDNFEEVSAPVSCIGAVLLLVMCVVRTHIKVVFDVLNLPGLHVLFRRFPD